MARPAELIVRAATAGDEPFLWRMLALAASMDGSDEAISVAKTDPKLAVYLDGYDVGFVAERDGVAIGAAWLRSGEPMEGKVWTPSMPELVIASIPDVRGEGVGNALLRAIVDASGGRFAAIALSVREENPAVRLYERFGFVIERVIVNRVGGRSLAMRRSNERTQLEQAGGEEDEEARRERALSSPPRPPRLS